MNIIGISAFYHDSAAALVQQGRIVAAAQEERFTRNKHDASFPKNAIQYCLEEAGLSIDELDAVVFYDKPLLKFERLLETYYNYAPKGWQSFLKAIPVWLKEKMFLKKLLYDGLKEVGEYDKKQLKLLFPEHHLSHVASAFYPSPFEHAAILTIDGVGEWATATICEGKGKQIRILKEMKFPHSVGLLYSAFTYYLGFKVNSGEYKLMGLAPYGNPESTDFKRYFKLIESELIDIKEDGSIWMNPKYFTYPTKLRMVSDKEMEKLFGLPKRAAESEMLQQHCDMALAIQRITEKIVLKMAAEAKRLTNADYLCMAGGVALNSVANGKLQAAGLFKDIFIQPAAGDAGGALGAALAAQHIYFEEERSIKAGSDAMQGAYLGPHYVPFFIERMAKRYKAPFQQFESKAELCEQVAKLISEGNVIGWMQGRMEFGPRALGARSIIGDARSEKMQRVINLKIKYRESFRPFAPSVLEEDVAQYFQTDSPAPYMLTVVPVQDAIRKSLPSSYLALPMQEKLAIPRSELSAVTHVDFSARIQTVSKHTNPRYWALLQAFKALTGYGVLINTSFNVRGEPIVCTPEDAYRCFMSTEMDYLVVGDFLFEKGRQPAFKEKAVFGLD